MGGISLPCIIVILLVINCNRVGISAKRDYYTFGDEYNDQIWREPIKQKYISPTPAPCYDFEPIVAYNFIVRGIVYNPLYLKKLFKYIKHFEIRGWMQIHPRPRNEMTGYFEGRKTPMHKMKDLLVTAGNVFEIFRSTVINNKTFLKNFTMIGFYMKESHSDLPEEIPESIFSSKGLPSTSSSSSELNYSYV
ncbi:uncharacterized protein LOC142325744 [Lycorma delicatula]|uniref:uncharacterized protein LOC142325744 n=1 Tax=Lycorma delicatula TaxID=130591 RepID=UPI003F5144AA